MPSRSAGSADHLWAGRILHQFYHSLDLVATYLRDEPQLDEICAVGGVTILINAGVNEACSRMVKKMGFTVITYSNRLGHFGEFCGNFYSWFIIWAFNPESLQNRPRLQMRRSELWMGREAFFRMLW